MRVHVYDAEIDGMPTVLVREASPSGVWYVGIRFWLHSTDRLHHTPEDDDRSAVTFWVPAGDQAASERLRYVLSMAADLAATAATYRQLGGEVQR